MAEQTRRRMEKDEVVWRRENESNGRSSICDNGGRLKGQP